MVLSAACWGLGTVATKAALNGLPPLTLLVVQMSVSVLFLWIIFFATKQTLTLGKDMVRLGLAGLLNPGMAYAFALIGLSMTTASMSSLLWAAEPALILGLAWFVLKERPASTTIIFSIVAITGAILVVTGSTGLESGGLIVGNLIIVVAVFCCAIYTVLTRQTVERVKPIPLIAVQLTVSLVLALLIWPIEFSESPWVILSNLQPSTWFWAATSGIIYYALAFMFYILGLRKMAASEAGLYLNLIPIFGIVGAYFFLGDRLNPVQWIGVFIILFAVLAISVLQKQGIVLRARFKQKRRAVELNT